MRLHHLINEIHELGSNTPRKASLDIYNILEKNKILFEGVMDADTFSQILNAFDNMAQARASEYNSLRFKDEFQKTYNLLSFYLNKII